MIAQVRDKGSMLDYAGVTVVDETDKMDLKEI